jgi:hypothetical protein
MFKLILYHHTKMGVLLILASILWEYPRIMIFQFLLGWLVDTINCHTNAWQLRSTILYLVNGLAIGAFVYDFFAVEHSLHIWKYMLVIPVTLRGGLVRIAGVSVYSLIVAIWEAVIVLHTTIPLDLEQYSRIHEAYVQEMRSQRPPSHLISSMMFSPSSTTQPYEPMLSYACFSGKIVLALFFCVVYAVAAFCHAPGLGIDR